MMSLMKRWIIAGTSVLAALLIAVVILLAVVIGQNNRAAEQARYDRARETCERELGPMTETNLDAWIACGNRLLD